MVLYSALCSISAACAFYPLNFQHSPEGVMQPKTKHMEGHLPPQQHFGKDVSCHVLEGAVHDVDGTAGNNLSNEMVSNINVFGSSVIVVVCCQL